MERRPKAIAVISAFLIAAAAIAAVVGNALLFPGSLLEWLSQFNRPAMVTFRAWGKAPGVLLVFLSAACVVASIELLSGRRWAWWFAVVLFATNGAGDAVSFVRTENHLRSACGAIISSAFLFVLSRDHVRQFCRR
jgi:hypothetical protein